MIFHRKKVAAALACLAGVGTAVTLSDAWAQVAPPDIRVDVTGSNIRRVEGEGALPVQIITREEIEREGIQTAIGLVERLSANTSLGGLNLSGSEGGTNVGYAAASLRGLGAPRTLVLLNGRRLANTSFSNLAVDVNSIPLSAIERVEVLTDGASAIYGTDAIAGVINFILRKDFSGFEASAYYGDSERGGGEAQRYNATAGWGSLTKDKFNVFGTFDYNKIDNIASTKRSFSKTSFLPNAPGGVWDKTSGNSIPANAFVASQGIVASPAAPECIRPFSFPTNDAAITQCRFDYASVIDIVPPSESWNVYGSARWQFAPDHQAFLEAAWSKTESTARVSPTPVSSATVLNREPIFIQPTSPFYPTAWAAQVGAEPGEPLEIFWRGLELGPRTDFNTIEQTRIVGGLQGLLAGWDYTVDANWSRSKSTTEWKAGWLGQSQIFPILNSGAINVFGLNTPQQIALMQPGLVLGKVIDATGTMLDVNAKASRDIWQLPAGPLALALGVEYRREEWEYNTSQDLSSGNVVGLGGKLESVPEVSRNIWAFFGELNIPIVKTVEADVALRYDDYGSIGSTWNPKVSLRWQPSRQVLVRAAAGTGFRAPGLVELHQQQFTATGNTYDDPLRCPATQSPLDCGAQFFGRQFGNPDLEPEESTQWTIGFVLEPVPQFSFGMDYWWIKIKNVIVNPPEGPLFNDMIAAEAAGTLVRFTPGSSGCPPSAQPGGIPCPVNFGNLDYQNLTRLTTSGIDVNTSYRFPETAFGKLTFALQGTYYIQWDQQAQGEGVQHLIGQAGGGVAATVISTGATGAFPRWKHSLLLGWNYGPWSANLNQTYVHGYEEPCDNPRNGVVCASAPTRRVGSWSVWGLNGSYTGLKNWTFTVGVKNLFDTDPPYSRQGQSFQIGYDPAIADPTGRFWYGAVKYAFR
jgi:iron complex outermembrane receptor protein